MGRDKPTLTVGGTTLPYFLAEKYSSMGPVCFCVDKKGRFPVVPYDEIVDIYPGCGPLNGIVSAFHQTSEDLIFLTAVDMPGGSVNSVQVLRDAIGDADACLFEGEPLFGLYRRGCLTAAEWCLRTGKNSFRCFLTKVKAVVLPLQGGADLRNLNTPEEYEAYISSWS